MSKLIGAIYQGEGGGVVVTPPSHLVSFNIRAERINASQSMNTSFDGWISRFPATRNPTLDTVFTVTGYDSYGNAYGLLLTGELLGGWYSVTLTATVLEAEGEILGTFVYGLIFDGLFESEGSLLPSGTFVPFTGITTENWVKWSDIGSLDFTIGRSNVAGERPLDWSGFVYCVKKLGSKVIVYGENGVSILTPASTMFGLETIYRIGLKGKHAVAGNDAKHFFVDNAGKLFKVTTGLEELGYSEFLSSMNQSIVLSYDEERGLLYICDGVLGFAYNDESKSFGKCSPNITGIGYKSGTEYITSSSAIVTDAFEICTDTFDFGVRSGKTIFSVELGTDLTVGLYVAVDWRRNKAESFTTTPWYAVSAQGRATVIAYGREMRVRVKQASYEYFELDYIKVNGVVDAY